MKSGRPDDFLLPLLHTRNHVTPDELAQCVECFGILADFGPGAVETQRLVVGKVAMAIGAVKPENILVADPHQGGVKLSGIADSLCQGTADFLGVFHEVFHLDEKRSGLLLQCKLAREEGEVRTGLPTALVGGAVATHLEHEFPSPILAVLVAVPQQ